MKNGEYAENDKILVNGANGIYVWKVFATNYTLSDWGISEKDAETLLNTDEDGYWDEVNRIEQNAKHVDSDGIVWRLGQNEGGDLCAWKNEDDEEDELEGNYTKVSE